ncbi:MAG TPA: CarD family transcriptional regulator [Beutenbergiaceae bacterium]|nr:CarD family transcriptional regulator [Beutenbergiaceae bacterium]
MNFSPGQVVVHPHHGPATLKKVTTRTVNKQRRRYLMLDVHHTDLSLALPQERAEELGLRGILDAEGVQDIFALLLEPSPPVDRTWSRRIKDYTTRFNSGNVRTIAALIRDMVRRDADKGLSFGERTVLRDAKEPFIAELSLAMSVPAEEVEVLVDTAVLEGRTPQVPGALAAVS